MTYIRDPRNPGFWESDGEWSGKFKADDGTLHHSADDVLNYEKRGAASVSEHPLSELAARITNYLSVGGLFNPEQIEHNKVRELLIDCRNALTKEALAGVSEREDKLIERAIEMGFQFGLNIHWGWANAKRPVPDDVRTALAV